MKIGFTERLWELSYVGSGKKNASFFSARYL